MHVCACRKGLIHCKIKTLQLLFFTIPITVFLSCCPFFISVTWTTSLYFLLTFLLSTYNQIPLKQNFKLKLLNKAAINSARTFFLWFFWVFVFLFCFALFPNIFNLHRNRKQGNIFIFFLRLITFSVEVFGAKPSKILLVLWNREQNFWPAQLQNGYEPNKLIMPIAI